MHTKLVEMAKTAEEMKEDATPASLINQSPYDYGLCIRLNNESLEKLDLDYSDVEVGDLLDFRAMGKVTSISRNDTGAGEKANVELQITHMGIPENESAE